MIYLLEDIGKGGDEMRKFVLCMLAFVIMLISFTYFAFIRKEEVMEPEFVLTYAENQSKDYPTTQAAYKFAELVKEKTDGKVLIEVKHSGELGTQKEVIAQLQFGGVDMTRVSVSSISDELPNMNVLQLPFLYRSEEQMWRVLESEVGTAALESLDNIGLVGLSWFEAGIRSFYSSDKSIETLADLQGKIIRVQESELMKDLVEILGGKPVEVPYSDVYAALETGKIDMAENNWASYVSEKHYEVAENMFLTEHARVPEIQMMSKRTWEKLPEEYREIILECAKESAEYEKELWNVHTEEAIAKARKNGCVISRFYDRDVEICKELVRPLYEKYCSEFMDLIEEIQAQS